MATHQARMGARRVLPPADTGADDLLDCAGSIAGTHAMVFGPAEPEIMCGLIRRGATEAVHFRRDDRSSAMPTVDLVILPCCDGLTGTAEALALAHSHLSPGGRLVLAAVAAGDGPVLTRLLVTQGFSHIRRRARPWGAVMTADLPFFGPVGGW
jgi:hypothetical protein